MRRALAWSAVAMVIVALAACGDGGGGPATTKPGPTTTFVAPGVDAVACLKVTTEALKLSNEWAGVQRSAGGPPDPAPYRERAEALRAEYTRLGCPRTILDDFPPTTSTSTSAAP